MLKLILLSITQSVLLVASQVLLKLAMAKVGQERFSFSLVKHLVTSWQMICSGLSILAAMLLWMYMLKNYEFSKAYPLVSLTSVLGIFAAILIFHETIPVLRWIGVVLIIIGVIFVAR